MSEVLVASPQTREVRRLELALERHGHPVKVIERTAEALLYIQHMAVSLVLIEADLVEMPALEFLSAVHAIPGKEGLPVVLMGDVSRSQAAGAALRAGAVDYLPCPVDAHEAVTIVERALSGQDAAGGAEGQLGFHAEQGVLIIRLPGQFDYASARELNDLLASGFVVPERGLVVNLVDTEYIASAGIGMLHLLAEECEALAGRVFMCDVRPRLQHLLSLSGVLHSYRCVETEQDALAAL